jgi:hypothetical protein
VKNDPRPQLTIQAKVKHGPAGPFGFQGRVERVTGNWAGTFDFSALNLGPELTRFLANFSPEAAEHARTLQGSGSARVDVAGVNIPQPLFSYDLHLDLKGGTFQHPQLPLLFEDIALRARC